MIARSKDATNLKMR